VTLRNLKTALTLLAPGDPELERSISGALASGALLSPLAQIVAAYGGEPWFARRFRRNGSLSREALQELSDMYCDAAQEALALAPVRKAWTDALEREVRLREQAGRPVVTVAGNFASSTGMGQSARCMMEILAAADIEASTVELPTTYITPEQGYRDFDDPRLLGWPNAQSHASITVANADSAFFAYEVLPPSYWRAPRQIGYWVWETEILPRRFAKSATLFDEIWTPSRYSAEAIRKTVNIPVHVVPHVINVEELEQLAPRAGRSATRRRLGLPDDALAFGYFFDAKSFLERKNPTAVLRAFVDAFGERDDVLLVLKVTSPRRGSFEYQKLRSLYDGRRNIVWIEETMTRAHTLQLMASLDAYVSLHRSEGFGLTLAEAMALGLPVVATGYSGNMDFMTPDTALLVEAPVITTKIAFGPYEAGTRWADPVHEDAVIKLRQLVDNSAMRELLGVSAKKFVVGHLRAQSVSRRVQDIL
jgi:glycosyltransferase involved in cell wall biosynthesis